GSDESILDCTSWYAPYPRPQASRGSNRYPSAFPRRRALIASSHPFMLQPPRNDFKRIISIDFVDSADQGPSLQGKNSCSLVKQLAGPASFRPCFLDPIVSRAFQWQRHWSGGRPPAVLQVLLLPLAQFLQGSSRFRPAGPQTQGLFQVGDGLGDPTL